MSLVEIPAEAAVDQSPATKQPQSGRQEPRRQCRDDPLQVPGDCESPAMASAERCVTFNRFGPRAALGEHGCQLAAARDAEVERGADALPREGEAVTGGVPYEEDRFLSGGTQTMGEPVALVTNRLEPETLGQRDGGSAYVVGGSVRGDANASLPGRRHPPTVSSSH